MDNDYQLKLELAAQAPDSAFPNMLFDSMKNDFDDQYFSLDYEDYGQDAVKVDPRFTRKNIMRIRGSTRRIDRYLEWVSLYDDYCAYLTEKYGSVEMAEEMDEAGILKDVLPRIDHRPTLRKGKARRMFREGIIPAFQPYGIDTVEIIDEFFDLLDTEAPDISKEEMPDIDWALNRELSSAEKKMSDKAMSRYRQQRRLEILNGGTSIAGIGSNMDFIDNYYNNVSTGMYDTEFGTTKDSCLIDMMKKEDSEKYLHQGQIWEKEDRQRNAGSGLYYQGSMLHDRSKEELFTIYKHLQEYAGVDVLGTMAHGNASKSKIRAVRAGLESVGAHVPMTKKQMRRMKERQRKIDRAENQSIRADNQLREVLLNNKIQMNNGTVRFEDMKRRREFDDDF